MLTAQQRFLQTMAYAPGTRPPFWEEGIRDEVWETWRQQDGSSSEEFLKQHPFDRYSLVEVNLHPIPDFQADEGQDRFQRLRRHYRTDAVARLPHDWTDQVQRWSHRDEPLGMTVSRGVFRSLRVDDWGTLTMLLLTMADDPVVIESIMEDVTDLSLWALDRVLAELTLDFAIFNEPIASFHAPVLSPAYYRRFALPHYVRVIERLRMAGIPVVVVQTYGNVEPLIPLWLEVGVNTLWGFHANQARMDYVALRQRYGKALRLIGGMNAAMLLKGQAAIDEELRRTVLPLVEEGGYLPMLDDRVRPGVPYAHYRYYRTRLESLVAGQ
ncbi:MAG: hypothetical protein HY710_13170 [Candidatus Latescibacteria bacterium]|nr:hypothetical protein [Candidatus Latescibacterota bacterium]